MTFEAHDTIQAILKYARERFLISIYLVMAPQSCYYE